MAVDGAVDGSMRLEVEERLETSLAQRRLGALLEASAALTLESEVGQVLQRILALAREMVAADAYAVWDRVNGGSLWEVQVSEGLSAEFCRTPLVFSVEGLPQEPISVADVQDTALYRGRIDLYTQEGIRAFLTVPLVVGGKITGALTFYYRQGRTFADEDLHYAKALANLAASALQSAELKAAQERESKRLSVLAEASLLLSSSLEYEHTVRQLTELAVQHVADWCSVDVQTPEGGMRRVAVAARDRDKLPLAHEYYAKYPEEVREDRGPGMVMRTGQPEVINLLPWELVEQSIADPAQRELLRKLDIVSVVTVPLRARGRSFGVLRLVTSEPGSVFTPEDVTLAVELAGRAAVAIENARLYENLQAELGQRARMEAALRHEQERLELVFSQTPAFVAVLQGPNHVFERTNALYRELVGNRNVVGKPLREALPEVVAQGFLELLDQVYRDGEAFRARGMRMELARGQDRALETRYADFIYQPLRDAEGRVTGILVQGADVTEAKLAELALERSEERFRTLVEAMPQLIWASDGHGRFDYLSQQWEQFTGVPEAEHCGMGWLGSVHPEDVPVTRAAWEAAVQTQGVFDCEYRLRRFDGTYRWFKARGVPVVEDGRLRRIFGTSTDIDDQKRTELALRIAHERMVIAQDTARMGAWEYDVAAGRLHWSDGVERLHGMEPGTFDGSFESWVRSVHPDDLDRCLAAVQQAMETGDYEIEYRSLRVDGSMYWAVARGVVQRAADGTPVRMIGVCMDVTTRKLAEEALRKAEKLAAAGRLAASIAHEINNPLESVTNLLYLAGHDAALGPQTRDWLQQAQTELVRISQITTLTLRFHRQSTRATPADLAQVLDSVLALHEGRLRNVLVEVRRRYRPPVVITGYESELRQVFANLVGNAIDAMNASEQRRLHVRVRATSMGVAGRGAVVTVADTGQGMTENTQQHLFEAFFSTKDASGTGLGLWVSKGILDKHCGTIRVRSSEGRGTVFQVFLPESLEEDCPPQDEQAGGEQGMAGLAANP